MASSKNIHALLLATTLLTCHVYPDTSNKTSDECQRGPQTMRVAARHIDPQGIGYRQGYTTLEGFFAWSRDHQCDWFPFLDLRGHVFNDGKLSANAGLGLRYLTSTNVWGANAYYDYRDTHHYHYNQVGFGLESLGKVWDFRLNGYFPVGNTKSNYYSTEFSHFHDHYAILSRKKEFAFKGFDAEVGTHLNMGKCPWYFSEGFYYLEGQGKAAWGGQARVVVDLADYVRIEGNTSYDHIFKWIGQGQLTLTVPFGGRQKVRSSKKKSCSHAIIMAERAVQNVYRHEIIPVDVKRVNRKAIDPVTNAPYVFYFVDNTSHSAGTYESPFNTLLQAQLASGPNNVIYVFSGDGTTNNMNAGITLQTNQRFWGSGTAQLLPTTLGTLSIPAMTSDSPYITNTGGDGITLANGVEVSGLVVSRASGNGISGNDVSDVSLLSNAIFNSTGHGIALSEGGSSAYNLNISKVLSANNGSDGINLQTGGSAEVALALSTSLLTANGNNGLTLNAANTSIITGNIQKNSIDGNAVEGVNLDSSTTSTMPLTFIFAKNNISGHNNKGITGDFSGTAPISVTLSNNLMAGNDTQNNNFGEGTVNFIFNGNNSNLTANYNKINGNFADGFYIQGLGTGNTFNLNFGNNEINGNAGRGIELVGGGGGNLPNFIVSMTNNEIDGNKFDANSLTGSFTSVQGTLTDNKMEGGGATGLLVSGTTATTLNLNLSSNEILGNLSQGIYVDNTNVLTNFLLNVANNTIIGNAANGIDVESEVSTLTISGSNISNNLGKGIYLTNIASANAFDASISNNTIANNASDGINIVSNFSTSSNATNALSISGNTLYFNQGAGLSLDVVGVGATSQTFNSTIASNNIAYNLNNGLTFLANADNAGFSIFTEINENTLSNNTLLGGQVSTFTGSLSTLVVDAIGNTLLNNGQSVANGSLQVINNTGGATLCLDLDRNYSDLGYYLNNLGAANTFSLVNTTINTGTVRQAGNTIQSVSSCP